MKFRAGQKVMVRPDLNGEHTFKVGITGEMRAMRGKVVTIRKVKDFDTCQHILLEHKDDHYDHSWQAECFIPIATSEDELFDMLVKGQLSDEDYKALRGDIDGR